MYKVIYQTRESNFIGPLRWKTFDSFEDATAFEFQARHHGFEVVVAEKDVLDNMLAVWDYIMERDSDDD